MSAYDAPFDSERVYRYTVPPGLETQIVIRTLPNAECRVYSAKNDGPKLSAYSDPDGFLELSVRPLAESDEIAQWCVDAATGNASAQHLLEIRSSHQPTQQMPLPPAQARPVPKRGARSIPPLELDDCLSLSDEELFERGYPSRPNPEIAPSAFDSWRRFVSAPVTFVEPNIVSRPDVSRTRRDLDQDADPRSFQESNNWSGYQVLANTGTFDYVYGEWLLPPALAGTFNKKTFSTLWIGLDGSGTPDLVQAGTEGDGILAGVTFMSFFYPWTLLLPQQDSAQMINNFPMKVGDRIMWSLFTAADAASHPSINGALAIFSILNNGTGQYSRVTTPRGSTTVLGAQADWIMERPTVNGGHADLANYGTATIKDPTAYAENPTRLVRYLDGNSDEITMVSPDERLLSTVTPVDITTMQFTWHNFA